MNIVFFLGAGFSKPFELPSSDTYMKCFLATPLADGLDLKSVDILDPEADAIVDRLKSDREGFGSTLKQKLRPFKGRWEDANYNVLDP